MDDESVGILLVLISAAGFATLGVLGIVAAEEGISIPTVLSLRFLFASAIVWAVLWYRKRLRLLAGRSLLYAIALGAVGYASMSGMYFLGLEFMTAGMVGIVLYTYPAFVVCFALLVRPERVTRILLLALGLTIAGVSLITGANPAGADPRGVAVVLVGAFAYAAYITLSQRVLRTTSPEVLTAHVLPAAAVTFILVGTATDSLALPETALGWGTVAAIAAIATAVPVLTFFAGIQRLGASRASIISTVEPGVTVLLGAVFLGEPVTAAIVAGGVLIVTGVLLIQRGSD